MYRLLLPFPVASSEEPLFGIKAKWKVIALCAASTIVALIGSLMLADFSWHVFCAGKGLVL